MQITGCVVGNISHSLNGHPFGVSCKLTEVATSICRIAPEQLWQMKDLCQWSPLTCTSPASDSPCVHSKGAQRGPNPLRPDLTRRGDLIPGTMHGMPAGTAAGPDSDES